MAIDPAPQLKYLRRILHIRLLIAAHPIDDLSGWMPLPLSLIPERFTLSLA